MEFLPETDMGVLKDAEAIICEGEEFSLLEAEQITIQEGNYAVRKFIDEVIAEQFMRAVTKNIRFNFGG